MQKPSPRPAGNAAQIVHPRALSSAFRGNEHDAIAVAREGASAIVTLSAASRRTGLTIEDRQRLLEEMRGLYEDPAVYGVLLRASAFADDRTEGIFCAGNDETELRASFMRDPEAAVRDVAAAYRLIWQLECCNKPTVAVIDGRVSGAALGLVAFGTHRVAGEGYQLDLPATKSGFFPDAGAAHLLSHLPSGLPWQIGAYLGLTARTIDRADACWMGLATHAIANDRFCEIEAALAAADPIDPILDERHVAPGQPPLEMHSDAIMRCFSCATVEEISARLETETRDRDWCAGVAHELSQRSPLSLKLSLRHIRNARHLDLRQTLIIDHRIACRLLARRSNEPANAPPRRLQDVTDAMVDDLYAPRPGFEMVLPTYNEM